VNDWDRIVEELRNKNSPNATYYFIPRPVNKCDDNIKKNSKKFKHSKPAVLLGPKFSGVKFTAQETECMKLALRGKTIVGIAETLSLSSRTVEYYFQRMRQKTNAISKADLIEKVLESDFVRNCTSV
jgi:DNA-binding CsgD family transcriptional regulator